VLHDALRTRMPWSVIAAVVVFRKRRLRAGPAPAAAAACSTDVPSAATRSSSGPWPTPTSPEPSSSTASYDANGSWRSRYESTSAAPATARRSPRSTEPCANSPSNAETIASTSIALLFAASGSIVPAGAATTARFEIVPSAVGATVPVMLKVAVAPTGRLKGAWMEPAPEAGQLAPADGVHVQETAASCGGAVSTSDAPLAVAGPALETTIVYVSGWPAATVVRPSVFVTDRSTCGALVDENSVDQKPPVCANGAATATVPASGWPAVPDSTNAPAPTPIAPPPSAVQNGISYVCARAAAGATPSQHAATSRPRRVTGRR
jgi:hypothetical protein